MYTLGIDIGSTTSKCVILSDGKDIVATALIPFGTGTKGPAQAFEAVLSKAGLSESDISFIMATGYGRTTFPQMNGETPTVTIPPWSGSIGTSSISPRWRSSMSFGAARPWPKP